MKVMRNKFGTKLSPGNSLVLLARLSRWFKENKGIDIVHYYSCNDVAHRHGDFIKASDLHRCEICSSNLYAKREEAGNFLQDSDMYFSQKKHMVLVDGSGKLHYTCYKVNSCFKGVGYECTPVMDSERSQTVPDLYTLLEVDREKLSEEDLIHFDNMNEEIYKSFLKPLLQKWMNSDIRKGNMMKFMTEFDTCLTRCRPFFEEDAFEAFKNKLLILLGFLI